MQQLSSQHRTVRRTLFGGRMLQLLKSPRCQQWLLLLLILATWEAIAKSGIFSPTLFPSLELMWEAFKASLLSGEFLIHLSYTCLKIFAAFGLGAAAGISVGVIIGTVRIAREIFEPLILVVFCIPLVTLLPLFILIFGIGTKSNIAFAAIYAFFPVCLNTSSALATIDRTLIAVGKSLGAKPITIFKKIAGPAALPGMVTGLQQGVSLAIIGTIVSESFVSANGLGYLIEYSFTLFRMPKVYAMAFVTLLIALGLNVALRRALSAILARTHHYHPSIGEPG
jgi:NitT/TauT family transport system permease protein